MKEATKKTAKAPFVVVRSKIGVFCGELVKHDRPGRAVDLRDARRIWKWTGANTCSEIAARGVAEKSCVSEPVGLHYIDEVGEVLACTATARENLVRSRWNP